MSLRSGDLQTQWEQVSYALSFRITPVVEAEESASTAATTQLEGTATSVSLVTSGTSPSPWPAEKPARVSVQPFNPIYPPLWPLMYNYSNDPSLFSAGPWPREWECVWVNYNCVVPFILPPKSNPRVIEPGEWPPLEPQPISGASPVRESE